ncbi:hypothetical protein Agub_g4067, partial [Astrephomene gubernaculifera]
AVERAMRYVALSNLSAALIQFPLTYLLMQQTPQHPHPQLQQQSHGAATPGAAAVTETHAGAPADSSGSSSTAPSAAAARSAAAGPHPHPPQPHRWRALLAGVFTPPTCASLAAVGVASVDWMQHALFRPTGCLRLVGEVTDALGAACIPLLLLVLGANLAHGPAGSVGGSTTHGSSDKEGREAGSDGLSAAHVVAVAVTRLLVLPA